MKISKYLCLLVAYIFGCVLPISGFAKESLSISHIQQAIYAGGTSDSVDSIVEAFLLSAKSSEDSLNCYVETGNAYRNTRNIEESLKYLDLATSSSYEKSTTLGKAYLAKALLYRSFADDLSSKENYEAAIDVFLETGESGNLLSACYQNLGKIYHRQGAYEKASELFFNDLRLGLSVEDSIRNYIELGNIWALGIEQAIGYYEKALSFDEISDGYKANIYVNLGELYASEFGEMEKASQYINSAFPILEKQYPEDPRTGNFRFFDAFRTLGDIHMAAGEYEEANTAYNDALEFGLAAFGSVYRREIGKLFIQKGNLAHEQKKYGESLAHFQQALKCVIPGFEPENDLALPKADEYYTENVIVEALIGKAYAYEGEHEQDGNHHHLLRAMDCYEGIHRMGQIFRKSYSYESAKLTLAAEHHQWNERAITTAYKLYELTNDDEFSQWAFSFSERSKAWVLLELMKEATAKSQLGLPASLMEREQGLKQEIMGLEEQMKAFAEQPEFVSEIKVERFRIQQSLDALIDSLEQQYPKYYAAKYEFKEMTVKQIQDELLSDDQSLIEYFWGQNERAFAFIVDKERFGMVDLGKVEDLEKHVDDFYTALQQPKSTKQYQTQAFALYGNLLGSLTSGANELSERLIIIPDGPLGYLPFDALLKKEVNAETRMKQMPYVLRDHSISYAYSGSLLSEINTSKVKHSRGDFLGIGPEFKGSDEFAFLPYSVKEIEQIKETLGNGDLLIREQATKASFLDKAPDFGVVHISSHAAVDDEDPMSSWIAFWEEDKDGNNLLSVRDLYSISLNASLAVLGACQTGYGDIRHGEGIMSLARGFTFAGCKSLVTTLWEANHWSTNQILEEFYIHLAKDLPKDQALRKAKLAYIDSENVDQQAAHPYYWAAATPIGDMNALKLRKRQPWVWMGGICLLLFGVWIGRTRKRVS